MSNGGWIGVDLDGTLAHYDGWRGPDHIGMPIQAMLERVHKWLAMGQTVKIFTARCSDPTQIRYVQAWLTEFGLGDLDITNVKDFQMIELWDDRCVRVLPNTGQPCCSRSHL